VLNLRSLPLAGKSLSEALGGLARGFTSSTGIRVWVQVDEGLDLPLRAEAELFRIAQEALSNVRQHAGAQSVKIRLSRRGQRLVLSIQDDGQGLVAPAGEGHHGIQGMRERAALLGGRLRVDSRPGRGVRVVAAIPLPEQQSTA
jgi:signal transduction histidine kinase